MVVTEKLIEFIKEALIPEYLKERLFPIAQVATDSDKRKIWIIINEYLKNAEKIAEQNPELTVEKQKHLLENPQEMRMEILHKGESISRKSEEKVIHSLEEEMEAIFNLS